jgi:hypothetical protein
MRNVFIVLIAVLATSVALADGPTVAFKYVDSYGTLSFTDDEKRVPAKYKAAAEKVTLGALGDYQRFTPISVAPAVVEAPTPVVTVTTPTKRDCGTVTFRSERRDHDGFNSRFFIAEDDCGILYDAPFYPDYIVRR